MLRLPLLFALVALFSSQVAGQAGALDETFGDGGTVRLALSADWSAVRIEGVALQPGGAVVVSGSADTPAGRALFVLRVTADGRQDLAFGDNGATVLATTPEGQSFSLAAQSDGRILISGDSDAGGFIARLTADGALDPTFNGGGRAEGFRARSFERLPDDRIAFLVCQTGGAAGVYVRLTPDGHFDLTFGERGLGGAVNGCPVDLAVYPDGRLVSVRPGVSVDQGSGDFSFQRFLPSGARESVWALSEEVDSILSAGAEPVVLGVDVYGRLYAGGIVGNTFAGGVQAGVVRYTPEGVLDRTFATDGVRLFSGRPYSVIGLEALRDGRILVLVGGSLLRLLPDGAPDPSFGAAGFADPGRPGRALVLRPDERAVIAGTTLDGSIVVTQYLGDRAVATDVTSNTAGLSLTTSPNPAQTRATVRVSMTHSGTGRVEVLDLLGRRMVNVWDGPLPAGDTAWPVDLSALSSGVYLVRITTPLGVAATRLTVAR